MAGDEAAILDRGSAVAGRTHLRKEQRRGVSHGKGRRLPRDKGVCNISVRKELAGKRSVWSVRMRRMRLSD